MQVRAAVVSEPSGAFEIAELSLADPRPCEVLVRMVATGICQTDLHVRDQHHPVPLPAVLGHEGAGVVERVGLGVRGLVPGDRVVLSYPSCGTCPACRTGHNPYCEHSYALCFGGARLDGSTALARPDGTPVHSHFFAQSSFATHALADASNVVKVGNEVPLERLGPLGCGFQTGAGAVLNAPDFRPGASLAVFGAGAVGLAAVMAGLIAGARCIVAVDVNPARLALAKELGATDSILAGGSELADQLGTLAPGGFTHVIDTTARPEMLALALRALAPLGTATLIGGAPAGAEASLDMTTLLNGRTVRGVIQGDAVPQVFIPELIRHHCAGRFPFDRLIRFYDFTEINQAVEDVRTGTTIKAVLLIGQPQGDKP